MTINYSPFDSKYGFTSPGFTVDAQGNLVASSLSTSSGSIQLADFVLSGSVLSTVGTTTVVVESTEDIVVGATVSGSSIPVEIAAKVAEVINETTFTVSPPIYVVEDTPLTLSTSIYNELTEQFDIVTFTVVATVDGVSTNPITIASPNVTFSGAVIVDHTLVADDIQSLGLTNPNGALNLTATSANINLTTTTRVSVTNSPLRLAIFATNSRDELISAEGDLVYNENTKTIDYYNGTWNSIKQTGNITFDGTTISAGAGEDISIIPQDDLLGVSPNVVVNDLVVNNQPTLSTHATRKDYVDTRISAFAIAFGA